MIKLRSLLTEKTYEVYRGDDKLFGRFLSRFIGKSTGVNTGGFWFSDSEDAAGFFGQHIRKFKIDLHNPLIVTSEEFSRSNPKGPSWFARKAKEEGYDGVIIQDIIDGDRRSTVYCVFSTTQIKRI